MGGNDLDVEAVRSGGYRWVSGCFLTLDYSKTHQRVLKMQILGSSTREADSVALGWVREAATSD